MSIVTSSSSLSALIQQYYMPVLYDNIFKKSHPLLALMKQKAQTFNGRQIVVPVEYQAGGQTVFGDRHGIANASSNGYVPTNVEIAQTATYNPEMLTGHFLLTKEETLLMNSPQAIKNIVGAKVQNLQKQLEKTVAENLFKTSQVSGAFDCLGKLLNNVSGASQSVAVGGITVTTDGNGAFTANEFWQTPVLGVADFADETGSSGGAHIDEGDLQDPSLDTYILRILARGIAKAKAQTGENPDLIVMSQYHYDLLESELGEFKRGSLESDRMAKMGFVGMSYRGIDIISDQDIVTAQASDIDGRMYFINTDYLYMFFNSGAKFTASDMVEDPQSNTFVQKVHTFGNMVVSNRKAHCVVKNLYSPRTYG